MNKKRMIKIILIVVIVCVIISSLSVVSFIKFGSANFVATLYGLCKVMFTDTELVTISENPTIVIGKTNATIDEYMLENGGYVAESDRQLGALYIYSNQDDEVRVMYSANGYYSKWVWQD